MWSIIEPCVGIVGGSLPFVKTLFVEKQRGSSADTYPSNGKSGIQVSKTWAVSPQPTAASAGPAFTVAVTADSGAKEQDGW